MALTRSDILQADDLPPAEKVDVPEWGGTVYVRAISAMELEDFTTADNPKNVRGRFAALTVCDADGKRIFKDEDGAALGTKSMAALNRVWAVAARLNGITPDEEPAKNLPSEAELNSS